MLLVALSPAIPDSKTGASRLSLTARMRRFNIATTPALQDGIAKELSEAGLLASGEQREPRLPEYEDVASKLPYLSAVRMLPLMPSLHHLCLTAAHVHAFKINRRIPLSLAVCLAIQAITGQASGLVAACISLTLLEENWLSA